MEPILGVIWVFWHVYSEGKNMSFLMKHYIIHRQICGV